jgi:hypothetical protein
MKLQAIQQALNVPKGQFNSFGGYKYRSCEDIISALKPLLKEHGCSLIMEDEIIEVGGRVYVKANVTLMDGETILQRATASAREAQNKKGMDEAQITGSASSYARKYALSGMFLIDDGIDPDKTNKHEKSEDDTRTIEAIDKCETVPQLESVWNKIKDQGKGKKFHSLVQKKKEELQKVAI